MNSKVVLLFPGRGLFRQLPKMYKCGTLYISVIRVPLCLSRTASGHPSFATLVNFYFISRNMRCFVTKYQKKFFRGVALFPTKFTNMRCVKDSSEPKYNS